MSLEFKKTKDKVPLISFLPHFLNPALNTPLQTRLLPLTLPVFSFELLNATHSPGDSGAGVERPPRPEPRVECGETKCMNEGQLSTNRRNQPKPICSAEDLLTKITI